ncbi:hypothetical protein HZC07_02650, partial [Candidatus Micrarchaeota archaeon]|nr:hypothetical protein [Candidatus Micrarchaeota archaeon]
SLIIAGSDFAVDTFASALSGGREQWGYVYSAFETDRIPETVKIREQTPENATIVRIGVQREAASEGFALLAALKLSEFEINLVSPLRHGHVPLRVDILEMPHGSNGQFVARAPTILLTIAGKIGVRADTEVEVLERGVALIEPRTVLTLESNGTGRIFAVQYYQSGEWEGI